MGHMLPADSAFAMLTCCTLSRRPLRGCILDSKNKPHTLMESTGHVCVPCRGRAGAREAVERGRGRSVRQRCSARMGAEVSRGMLSGMVRI